MCSSDLRFTWASPSVANVVGWTAEEVCGQSVLAYLHPHDAPRLLELREQMAEGRTSVLRARALRSDGTYRWLELSIKPIYENGELVGRLTAYRDIHVEVEAQDALAASERLFRMLAENATDVVAYADQGLLAWVSPSVTAALGWEAAEMVGKSLVAYAHPGDVTAVAERLSSTWHDLLKRQGQRNRQIVGLDHAVHRQNVAAIGSGAHGLADAVVGVADHQRDPGIQR